MSFAEEFERDLARAGEGDVSAQRDVGEALLRGTVVPRNLELGREWLDRAIEQRDIAALRVLAAHDLLAGKLGRGPRAAWTLLQRGCAWGDEGCTAEVTSGIRYGLALGEADRAAYFERTGLPAVVPAESPAQSDAKQSD